MTVAAPNRIESERIGFRRTVRAYVSLTKPRVVELLIVVTIPTMILAAHGIPNLLVLVATVIGGWMSAGSAGAFNCYIDRDIDRVMKRTENRPLVTGEITPRAALIFATALGLASILVLGFFTNWVAAGLSLVAILLYVVFYTIILKRRTAQNIVWGGIAGCMPVLIGWAAVTGTLGWAPLILFGVIFLWTPPHYWPLSMKYRDDYAMAGVPMLSVVRGRAAVGLQVILYAWAMVACSLLLIPVAGMGVLYTAVALGAGGWFIWESHHLYNRSIQAGASVRPMRVFHGSIAYLTLLFLAVAFDPLVRMPL